MLFGNADWRNQVGAEIPSQQWLSIFSISPRIWTWRLIKTAFSSPRPASIDPEFRPSNRPTTRASSLSTWLYSVSPTLQSVVHALLRSPDRTPGHAGFSSHKMRTAEPPIAQGIQPDRDCQTSPKA